MLVEPAPVDTEQPVRETVWDSVARERGMAADRFQSKHPISITWSTSNHIRISFLAVKVDGVS